MLNKFYVKAKPSITRIINVMQHALPRYAGLNMPTCTVSETCVVHGSNYGWMSFQTLPVTDMGESNKWTTLLYILE